MSWSTKEMAFCVEAYFACNSYKVVQQSFQRKFQCRHAPSKSRIFGWMQKFREYETVQNLNSKSVRDTYSGRPASARTQRNIDAVQDSVDRSPKKSLRRRSQLLGISRESLRRVLKENLHLYPYKIQIHQKLTEVDMEKRVTICEWFCDTIEANPNFLDHVWFSDKADFLLSQHVNSKNNVYRGLGFFVKMFWTVVRKALKNCGHFK